MNTLISLLQSKGIDREFAELGFEIQELFVPQTRIDEQSEENPYKGYEWIVRKNVEKIGTIINAVPPDEKMDYLPWEEWFVLNGEQIHHVLYLKQLSHYDEIFEAPQKDGIHPDRTIGKRWYVLYDTNMKAALLQ